MEQDQESGVLVSNSALVLQVSAIFIIIIIIATIIVTIIINVTVLIAMMNTGR